MNNFKHKEKVGACRTEIKIHHNHKLFMIPQKLFVQLIWHGLHQSIDCLHLAF